MEAHVAFVVFHCTAENICLKILPLLAWCLQSLSTCSSILFVFACSNTVIDYNKPRDLFLPITVAACKKQMNIELQFERVYTGNGGGEEQDGSGGSFSILAKARIFKRL